MEILKLGPIEWAKVSREVHAEVHDKDKPASWDRIDYAILMTQGDKAVAYITCREHDHESIYWQFGGGFTWARNSILMKRAFSSAVKWQLLRCKRISMLVENSNVPMLKLAMSEAFLVRGTRMFSSGAAARLLLELGVEKHEHDTYLREHSKLQASSEKATERG